MNAVTETVAVLVRRLRQERGWSAQRLADECARLGLPALNRSTLAKIESGVRKSVTGVEISTLARAFGVPVSVFLGGEDDRRGYRGLGDDSWRVRVHGRDGAPRGAGFLVTPNHVLTCASVVSSALDLSSPGPAAPVGTVLVDFPGSVTGDRYPARVIEGGWFPADPDDGRGDLAVLELDGPLPVEIHPAEVRAWRDTSPTAVRVFGHPRNLDDGVWASARPMGSGGPRGEWVQVDGLTAGGHRIGGGFSGAGVIDEDSRAVIGLVVAEHAGPGTKIAWAMPIETAAQYWAPLADLVRSDPPAPGPTVFGPGSGGRSGPVTRLSLNDRRRLAEAVLRVPSMSEPELRRLYTGELAAQLGEELVVEQAASPYQAVWDLVRVLLEHDGGVRMLADVLRAFHPQSVEMAELDELVEVLFPDSLLAPPEREALRSLIAGFGPAQMSAALPANLVGGRVRREMTWSDPDDVIARLEEMASVPGAPPLLLAFVDGLAHAAPADLAAELHHWLDRVGSRLGFEPAVLRQLHADTEVRRSESQSYQLVVELAPDAIYEDQYLLSATLHRGNAAVATLLRDDEPRSLDRVADDLDALLTNPEMDYGDVDELTVELLLPRKLLDEPVDQWQLRSFPHTLGIRHPVVVRSLDRMRNRASHPQWRRKWRWLAEHGETTSGESIYWHSGTVDRPAEALYAELVGSDHLVCLVVPFSPDRFVDPDRDPFWAALVAGIPAIVWYRRPYHEVAGDRFIHEMRNLLDGRHLRELPALALQLRREAQMTSSDRHIGRHLSVLWDDPDRIPESVSGAMRLRAPE